MRAADTFQAFGHPTTIYLSHDARIHLRAPLLVALVIICPQIFIFFLVSLSCRLEHAKIRMNLDADLLLILRNSVPYLSAFFDHALRGLETFDLGLLATPIHDPQGVRRGGRPGWPVLGPNDDWY